MALMLSRTYDAFVAAGAPEDKAREAAEEIAGLDERLNRIDRRLGGIESRLGSLQWVIGIQGAILAAGVLKLILG